MTQPHNDSSDSTPTAIKSPTKLQIRQQGEEQKQQHQQLLQQQQLQRSQEQQRHNKNTLTTGWLSGQATPNRHKNQRGRKQSKTTPTRSPQPLSQISQTHAFSLESGTGKKHPLSPGAVEVVYSPTKKAFRRSQVSSALPDY